MSFLAFDQDVMREPWTDRRKRLEDVLTSLTLPRVGLVPVTEDAAKLYQTWGGWGGEGIVLKEPTSMYRPGIRTPALRRNAEDHQDRQHVWVALSLPATATIRAAHPPLPRPSAQPHKA